MKWKVYNKIKKRNYASENEIIRKERSSSLESTEFEDFSWINLRNNNYTFDTLDENRVIRKGFGYQDSVSKILTKDIFKNECILTESMKYLAVQKDSKIFLDKDNNYIIADFSVKEMDINNFNDMLKIKFRIKDTVKKITSI